MLCIIIGSSTTTTNSMNLTAIPGLSGLSLTAKDTKFVSNNKTVLKQNDSKLSTTTPKVSSSTTLLPSQEISSLQSNNTSHSSSSSHSSLNSTLRNPYALNKNKAKAVLKQNDSKVLKTTPSKVSSSTTSKYPQQPVSSHKSVNMTLNSSSQPGLSTTVKNPYVLNKKETFGKTVVQKSKLKWSKSSLGTVLSSEGSKSLSDSELCTKKSSTTAGQLPSSFFTKGKSSAMIHSKAPSMSNLQGSYKWSKTKSTASSALVQRKKNAKKSKPSVSKLKWTNPGIPTAQVGSKRKLNPYVLRKENVPSGSGGQKQGVKVSSRTANRSKLVRRPMNSTQSQVPYDKIMSVML